MYSNRLNDGAIACLKYAMVLHLLMGCWVFSAQNSLGANMFPRPVTANEQIIAISGAAFSLKAESCLSYSSVAECTAASKGGCVWTTQSTNYSCVLDPAAGGPLQLMPRLFNDITFPYLILTILCASAILLKWTPLWPIVRSILRMVWAMLHWILNRGAESVGVIHTSELATYNLALQKGLFGNAPSTYDVTLISPYDELFLLESNYNLFCGHISQECMPEISPNDSQALQLPVQEL
uniref:Uncharacterized protein n=2 Tax=Cryptomonas curvata TaxID=233186 RepID=A0A7S0N7S9_9CRYP|mmetsp:Transcript_8757/g.18856  ORF Transcript_8757/g.18856 Transcript_8757/m.18856 type:complete len:237 (+) Transcript_8757:171-881(+)